MTPREAKTMKQAAKLKRDNISFEKWWMAITGEDQITICQQAAGEPPGDCVSVPGNVFRQMLNWYNTGSKNRTS